MRMWTILPLSCPLFLSSLSFPFFRNLSCRVAGVPTHNHCILDSHGRTQHHTHTHSDARVRWRRTSWIAAIGAAVVECRGKLKLETLSLKPKPYILRIPQSTWRGSRTHSPPKHRRANPLTPNHAHTPTAIPGRDGSGLPGSQQSAQQRWSAGANQSSKP